VRNTPQARLNYLALNYRPLNYLVLNHLALNFLALNYLMTFAPQMDMVGRTILWPAR